ncbi:MAG: 50S ribosomal protein L18 [Candidatus Pacebacteria bacterium]|nr:50S ribosomal protein L18 [Candidatus Paceibacterota bacterium]MDD2757335.1 50S ribosomal protein L18 [Candidatus Paceibacterota bacterium]MDD3283467.1 50S ribosomal protein L18 [Candidatus Paceibacterota bacterium]MDD3969677.1 50S ribosomal protein L18 [Candidatus Paceibacterota bacterium]MDD4737907.1 50S ribosomal protein L18 [Candidatus Paceibacterota bacterium]
MIEKKEKRIRRHKRVTSRIGSDKPRLCVFRSNQFIYAQIIDNGKTIISVDDKGPKAKDKKIESSKKVGQLIAQKAIENKINEVVFDRGGYKYHGRVKSLAEGAREGGLKF